MSTATTSTFPAAVTAASREAALEAAIGPWLARADRLIADRLADARAHAEAGRMFDANQRLGELRRGLIDDQSGTGSLLSNARAAFYRQAFRMSPFDPAIHREIQPTPEGELAARHSKIADRNQHCDARLVLEEIAGSLHGLSVSAAIGRDWKPPEQWRSQFNGWQTRKTETLSSHIRMALSDSQMALTEAVGRIMVKPELL